MNVVHPDPIDDVLVNPHVGFTTFHRFNGDSLDPEGRWPNTRDDDGPAEHDEERLGYPECSVAYFRWYWSELEPERGEYRWEVIDDALGRARERGQKLDFRLMPHNGGDSVPEWYRETGKGQWVDAYTRSWLPDYSDPFFLNTMTRLIEAMGERYDGHPDVNCVDVGSVGHWGEWHTQDDDLMPPPEVKLAVVDAYVDAFETTPLLMLIGGDEALRSAVERGTGWRADCLGDMPGGFEEGWCHMYDVYPRRLADADAEDAWKEAPVSLESCWTMQHWKDQGWDVEYILEKALDWHVSTFNNKSSAVPEEWRPQVREFRKRMGYRFVLSRFAYPSTVEPYSALPVEMYWENKGVAPCYRPYDLVLKLSDDDGSATIPTRADVTGWMPGDNLYEDTLLVPETVTPGTYDMKLALVDPRTGEPAIRLAIEGRDDEGWYSLGRIDVE